MTVQLSDYQCNDNVYYISNNLEDLDYRGDNIHIQPSPNEFSLRALLPGNVLRTVAGLDGGRDNRILAFTVQSIF